MELLSEVSLVVTVFGSFLFLYFVDGTMQRVSLASFVLAMGMLVDNAIVIIDGILVDLKAGKSRMEAMTAIGRQTAMPLLGATLIAIIAFLPIFMSPDTAGVYTRDLFIVLAVSLGLSWILAFDADAVFGNFILKENFGDSSKDPYDTKFYNRFVSVLRGLIKHKVITIVSVVCLFLVSMYIMGIMPQKFLSEYG